MKNKKILCFITFGLVIAVLCSTLCFSSFAYGAPSLPDAPTDLTGYTVYVPSGWTADAGSSINVYDLSGRFSNDGFYENFRSFNVGYNSFNDESVANSVFFITDSGGMADFSPSDSLSFTVTGGSDSVSFGLQNWLYANNATFTPTGSNTSYTINEGYYLPTSSIDITDESVLSIGVGNTLIYEMPSSNGWINNDGFTTYIDNIRFTLESANPSRTAYKIDVSYFDGYEDVLLATYVKASSGTVQYTSSNGFKAFYIDEPFEVDTLGNELFNGLFTFSQYEPGAPIPPPDVSSVLEIFLQGVANALDTDIFGYFSILDLVKILVAASFIVWLLKMLAGG